ncbi:MAG: isopentenyl-diphosphate Delta-isomerase [Woeseiaceae bacterium]
MESAHRIVSSEAEQLILVDENDSETGFLSKAECHDGAGQLHRAFSVFLFNDAGELLIQRRSPLKRLWPGYWSNTCCSHPRKGESMPIATQRRLYDELHIESYLEFVYKFAYQADFGEAGAENELCHVYLGRVKGDVVPNEHEIDAIRYLDTKSLLQEFESKPHEFTPWFKMEWLALANEHHDTLSRYLNRPD